MNNNFIMIDGIINNKFNFKKTLKKTDSIMWKKCFNLKISIKSKINKLLIINCKDIDIKIGDTISGIEIENSNNINIKCRKNTSIKYLNSYKSNVKIKVDEKQKDNISFDTHKSVINFN